MLSVKMSDACEASIGYDTILNEIYNNDQCNGSGYECQMLRIRHVYHRFLCKRFLFLLKLIFCLPKTNKNFISQIVLHNSK